MSGFTHDRVIFYWPTCRFAELGHSVVGVEASYIPIEEFFSVHKLQYTVEDCELISGQLYKVGALHINKSASNCVVIIHHWCGIQLKFEFSI